MKMGQASGSMGQLNNIITNAKLSDYTTFRLGGNCKKLITCQTADELIEAVQQTIKNNENFILIGGGSNLVVSDEGFDGTVIRYLSKTPQLIINNNTITVSASTILDDLALSCIEHGLSGLNFTSGIPGTVGGAVVGNAGAWGKQVGDVFQSARIIQRDGSIKTITQADAKFDYRHSGLKDTGGIVIDVTFNVSPADPIELARERAEILKMRHDKHPNLETHPCAGSFFRNVEPTSKAERRQAAGWFLEQAGGKELSVGGAQIFPKHANIIIKAEGCKAQDVYDLHLKMISIVKEKFGFKLQREVRFVGSFKTIDGSTYKGIW